MLKSIFKMEPVVGVEPTTYGLQNRCSTTELNWLFYGVQRPAKRIKSGVIILLVAATLASQFATQQKHLPGPSGPFRPIRPINLATQPW